MITQMSLSHLVFICRWQVRFFNCNVMDSNSVYTLAGSQELIVSSSSNKNILEEIKNVIFTWTYKSEYNLDAIKDDLENIIETITRDHFDNKMNDDLHRALNCIVYNEIYENLIPLIRGNYSKEDLYLYEKCQYFCKRNVSPGEFGSNRYKSIPFTAAVVELSVLDSYKSPLEKINCLCATYDLIFAELKLALVLLISKYSEKECEIPIINNEEVVPILMLVVIKSKLLYLASNLFFIRFFADNVLEGDSNLRLILEVFEQSVNKLMEIDESSLLAPCDKLSPNLDVRTTMEIISSVEDETNDSQPATLGEENKRRLVALITTSTAEKNFIPLDLPKIFS